MPKEIDFSSYECDCGHQLHFAENTISEMKEISFRKPQGIGEGSDRHTAIFHKGEFVAIFCPKVNAKIPVSREQPPPDRANWTAKQGQVLSFIYYFTKLNRCSPSESDIAKYFQITGAAAHGMVVTLDRKGFITRQPGVGRSIRLAVDVGELPELD